MSNPARKKLLAQLNALSRAQLIALATQRAAVTFPVAMTLTSKQLVTALQDIEDVLVPVSV